MQPPHRVPAFQKASDKFPWPHVLSKWNPQHHNFSCCFLFGKFPVHLPQSVWDTLTPDDFGIQRHSIEALKGGEPAENAEKITALLKGKGEAAHIDAVAVNTAMLMRTFGERDLKANVQRVKDLLRTDKAYQTLQKLAQYQ